MKDYENNGYFWQKIDSLLMSSSLQVELKKGDNHPKYNNLKIPFDFGYLTDLHSEHNNIEFYRSNHGDDCDAMIISVNILLRVMHITLLIGMNEEEKEAVLRFENQTDFQKTIMVKRGNIIPSWSIAE